MVYISPARFRPRLTKLWGRSYCRIGDGLEWPWRSHTTLTRLSMIQPLQGTISDRKSMFNLYSLITTKMVTYKSSCKAPHHRWSCHSTHAEAKTSSTPARVRPETYSTPPPRPPPPLRPHTHCTLQQPQFSFSQSSEYLKFCASLGAYQ